MKTRTTCVTGTMIGLVASISALVCGCAEEVTQQVRKSGHYRVVATTGMVADIVRQIVGDKGAVEALMGEGVDPHLYKTARGDIAKVLDVEIIFYSGLMLEGRMVDTFIKAMRQGKQVYAVTELIDDSYLLEPPEFKGHWDPHVWMDIIAWSKCVDADSDSSGGPSHAPPRASDPRGALAGFASPDPGGALAAFELDPGGALAAFDAATAIRT